MAEGWFSPPPASRLASMAIYTPYDGKYQSVIMYFRTICLVLVLVLSRTASATVAQRSAQTQVCSPSAIPYPRLFGAQITSLTADERYNYSYDVPQGNSQFAQNLTDLAFCNVNITYTHSGANDSIHVQVWLPLTEWTGRFQGTGGGGYQMGEGGTILAPAIAKGYAAASTDGGHVLDSFDPSSWALLSPGNVNMQLLLDFSSVCLNDMAILGKAVTESYYGVPPKYSYWNGCSTGGRQGFMNAQRYPDLYDGILVASSAINWAELLVAAYWGQLVMNTLGYPPPCEVSAFTAAAIGACDGLDGVMDGIIAAPGLCNFDPHTLVGQSFDCSGTVSTYSAAAATIVQAAWTGARTIGPEKGSFLWYGLNPDASLPGPALGLGSLATVCTPPASLKNCSGFPFPVTSNWIIYFVEKNPDFNILAMNYSHFDTVFHESVQQYQSIIGTADADLSAYKANGGKMIAWHGLADQLVPPNGSSNYYDRVVETTGGGSLEDIQDFYRLFFAPGVGHCGTGVGPYPGGALESLVDWVEEGIVPQTLAGTSLPHKTPGGAEVVYQRPLCAYPLVAKYTGGDPTQAGSFECAAGF